MNQSSWVVADTGVIVSVTLNSSVFHAFYREGMTYLREENSSKHINF